MPFSQTLWTILWGEPPETIANVVESRLRAMSLFKPMVNQHIFVSVNLVGDTSSTLVYLVRHVSDTSFGHGGLAIVWYTGSSGTHDGKSQFILRSLSRHLDTFIIQYLRVNEKECAQK